MAEVELGFILIERRSPLGYKDMADSSCPGDTPYEAGGNSGCVGLRKPVQSAERTLSMDALS